MIIDFFKLDFQKILIFSGLFINIYQYVFLIGVWKS